MPGKLVKRKLLEDVRLIRSGEAARILNRHPFSVYRYQREGLLPLAKLGKNGWRYFRECDVLDLAKRLNEESE